MRNFLRLKDFFIRHKWYYIFGILAMLAVDILQLLIPRLLGQFTDSVRDRSVENSELLAYAGWIVLVAIGMVVGRFAWRMFVFGAARNLEYTLRNDLFAQFQKLSTSYFNTHKTGDLMAHATNDISAVRMAMGSGIIMSFDSLILLTSTIFMMVTTISVKLTVVALLPLPFMAVVSLFFGRMIHSRFRNAQESFSNVTDKVQENISGMRVVKAFVQENEEIKKFTEANEMNVERNMALAKVQAIFNPTVQFISGLSLLIVLAYGGMLVINHEITLGEFVAFNAYLGLLTWPTRAIGWIINILQRGAASMARLNEIFNTKPEIVDNEETLKPVTQIEGKITFNDLTFKYPGSNQYALKNVSLEIEKGKTLAIFGKTGSGKTTLTNLLLRLYNVDRNKIFIDDVDIHDIPLKTLRDSIGYVPQDNFLFSTTITENVAFGLDNYTQEQVEKATEDAQVLDNIVAFPQGFNTYLGERGVTLSGGQKQRVSIARALIKNPSILILDDSLSAVDTKTEEAILERLKRIMKDRTSIIIAHRVSTLKEADEIVVLDDGEIVEQGTHEDLLELKGHYYDLYQKQLLEEMIANH